MFILFSLLSLPLPLLFIHLSSTSFRTHKHALLNSHTMSFPLGSTWLYLSSSLEMYSLCFNFAHAWYLERDRNQDVCFFWWEKIKQDNPKEAIVRSPVDKYFTREMITTIMRSKCSFFFFLGHRTLKQSLKTSRYPSASRHTSSNIWQIPSWIFLSTGGSHYVMLLLSSQLKSHFFFKFLLHSRRKP